MESSPLESSPLESLPSSLPGDIILGGGVCGCLLAHRLLQLSDRPVSLIEAGGRQDENAGDRNRPARWLHLLGSSDDDPHTTTANEALAGRRMSWPRGRGLGGSGRINAMIWMPPHVDDFQMLADAGLELEALRAAWQTAQQLFGFESPRYLSDASKCFLATINEHRELGSFAPYQRINSNSRRWTTAQLLTDLGRSDPDAFSRLRCVQATAERLNIHSGRVESLTLRDADGARTIRLQSDARVISCLGALATPTLLLRSGIGPTDRVNRNGVQASISSPRVGQNLHDHLIMPVVYSRDQSAFLPDEPSDEETRQWRDNATGPLASNIAECGGFDPAYQFQLHVTPTDYLRYPHPKSGSAMTLGVQLTRPRSRGWLELDDDPANRHPIIHSRYLSAASDIAEMPDGVRWVRRIAEVLSAAGCLGEERVPGPRRLTHEALLASISRYAQTLYHPGGTAAIGTNAADAVVDREFNVLGIERLSIVDASLLPEPSVGNPSATLAMLTCYAAQRLTLTTR